MPRAGGGKWAYLRGQFPLLPADPQYGDVLHAKITARASRTIPELIAEHEQLEARIAEEEGVLQDARATLEAVLRVLTDQMEALGLDSFTANGRIWTPGVEPHPIVKDRDQLRRWAQDVMPDAIPEPQLPWNTLKAVTKERLEQGETLPPGVDVYLKPKFSRRKA